MVRKTKAAKVFVIIGVIVIILIIMLAVVLNKASVQRKIKSISSDYSGGLERTVTVYDYNSNIIKQYEGKIDIEESSTDKVKFDLDGKRYIIYGGIVIVDEN